MTEPGDEFETFLKTRTVLPNGMSDDDKLEPPKALDAIVLKEARAAIRERQRLNRAPRWARPVALAATILLCLSIVLNVSLNTNRPAVNLQRMSVATADKASPTPAGAVSEGERRERVADGASSNEAILPEAKTAAVPRTPRPPVVAEAAAPALSPAAVPAPGPAAAAVPKKSLRADGPAADKVDALASRSGTPAAGLSPAPSDTDSVVGRPAQLAKRTGTPAPGLSEAPSPTDSAVSRPAQLADRSHEPTQELSEVVTTSARSTTDSAETLAARGYAATAAARAPATATREPAAAPHPKDPKTWLQQIAALRAEGKNAQADAEMQRFRDTFPAYPAKPGRPP